MGRLFTGVLSGVLGMVFVAGSCAQGEDLHPVLGKKPPLEVLNKDLSAMPKRERQAFIHGVISQMIAYYSVDGKSGGRCLSEWYFTKGDGDNAVKITLEKYPDYPVITAINALARRACPAIKE